MLLEDLAVVSLFWPERSTVCDYVVMGMYYT
jgi:hypothetical protein